MTIYKRNDNAEKTIEKTLLTDEVINQLKKQTFTKKTKTNECKNP